MNFEDWQPTKNSPPPRPRARADVLHDLVIDICHGRVEDALRGLCEVTGNDDRIEVARRSVRART